MSELTVRLRATEADRDDARERVAQLAAQVADLATALTRPTR